MRLPKHLNMTSRQFKAEKRKQFKELCSFIDDSDVTLACAFLPNEQYEKLTRGIKLIFEARKELRPWWRRA